MPSDEGLVAFGDTVLVSFPFTSQAASKQRPAVVVSSRAYNSERRDVILMAITSQLRPSPTVGDVWLHHWSEAGLPKPSAIKPVIATLERRLIVRGLGALSSGDAERLRSALLAILG